VSDGSPPQPKNVPFPREWPWHEGVLVFGLASVAISAHFEFSEQVYALTRRWEFLQLDEVPTGLAVLALGLIWLCWRRIQYAQRELYARRAAEASLEAVLVANRKLTQEYVRLQEAERKHLA